jgi:hypothetical protein
MEAVGPLPSPGVQDSACDPIPWTGQVQGLTAVSSACDLAFWARRCVATHFRYLSASLAVAASGSFGASAMKRSR